MERITFKILIHEHSNQYGWGVSLVKYVNGELYIGFLLAYHPNPSEQERYAKDFAALTGWECE